MKHRVTVKILSADGPLPAPASYDIEVEDPIQAHQAAADRYRAENMGGMLIRGWHMLTAREELTP
jgi:hypothetical protein